MVEEDIRLEVFPISLLDSISVSEISFMDMERIAPAHNSSTTTKAVIVREIFKLKDRAFFIFLMSFPARPPERRGWGEQRLPMIRPDSADTSW